MEDNPIHMLFDEMIRDSLESVAPPEPQPQLSGKAGGYPDEMFVSPMNEEERTPYECSICYLMARRARTCKNQHRFCSTCLYDWSLTRHANSDRCPVCRCDGPFASVSMTPRLANMSVKCTRCPWTGLLVSYKLHIHGKEEESEIDSLQERAAAPATDPNNIPPSVAEFLIRRRQAQLSMLLEHTLAMMQVMQRQEEERRTVREAARDSRIAASLAALSDSPAAQNQVSAESPRTPVAPADTSIQVDMGANRITRRATTQRPTLTTSTGASNQVSSPRRAATTSTTTGSTVGTTAASTATTASSSTRTPGNARGVNPRQAVRARRLSQNNANSTN